MIDGKTKRLTSDEMRAFFQFIREWNGAFFGKNIVAIESIETLLHDVEIIRAIESDMDFGVIPPRSGSDDLTAMSIFAVDPDELKFTFFWWRNDGEDEPLIIDYDDGSTNIFASLREFITCLANDDLYSEIGEVVYSELANND